MTTFNEAAQNLGKTMKALIGYSQLNPDRVSKFSNIRKQVESIKKEIQPGELLYFYPEEMLIQVIMVGDDGVRYFEPTNIELSDDGNIITRYATFEAMTEWTKFLGNLTDLIEESSKWKLISENQNNPQ